MKEINQKFSILAFVFLLIWIVFVLGGYYVYHKPFSPQQVIIWIKGLYQTIVGFLIVICAGGIGLRVIGKFFPKQPATTIQSVGVGFGILGTSYLGMGWIIGVRWYLSLILIGLMLIWSRRSVVDWLQNLIRTVGKVLPTKRPSIVLAILIGLLMGEAWLVSLSPPLAFDSLVYHLSLPLAYIQNGRFIYTAWNTFWGMPQLGEMLYTMAMSLGGMEAGTVFGWMIGALSVVGLGEMLYNDLSKEEIWIAYSAVFCGSTFAESLGWGYVDWIAFFFGVCILLTFKQAINRLSGDQIVLAGIFSGFALGTKYTAGVVLIASLLAIVFLHLIRSQGGLRRPAKVNPIDFALLMKSIIMFLAVVLIVSLPWWLKNIVAVRQPFYPILFPAGEISLVRLQFYSNIESWGKWYTALFLPFTSTILGIEGKEGFNATIGPLFLLFSPLALLSFVKRDNPEYNFVWLTFIFAMTGWVVWGIGSRIAGYLIQSRLYWAIFPSLVVLVGFGCRHLSQMRMGSIRMRVLVDSMAIFVMFLTSIEVTSSILHKRVFDFVSGQIGSQDFLTHNLGWHYYVMQDLSGIGNSSQTLLLFEPRSLYCLPKCDGDEILDEWYLASLGSSVSVNDVIQLWKERNYRYLLVYDDGAKFVREHDRRYRSDQWRLFDRLRQTLPRLKTYGEAYSLYMLP